jgi:hypothetical protein
MSGSNLVTWLVASTTTAVDGTAAYGAWQIKLTGLAAGLCFICIVAAAAAAAVQGCAQPSAFVVAAAAAGALLSRASFCSKLEYVVIWRVQASTYQTIGAAGLTSCSACQQNGRLAGISHCYSIKCEHHSMARLHTPCAGQQACFLTSMPGCNRKTSSTKSCKRFVEKF